MVISVPLQWSALSSELSQLVQSCQSKTVTVRAHTDKDAQISIHCTKNSFVTQAVEKMHQRKHTCTHTPNTHTHTHSPEASQNANT